MKSEYRTNSISFYPKFHKLVFEFSTAGYFDERPEIHTCITTLIGFLSLIVALPVFGWHPVMWLFIALLLIPFGQIFIHIPYKSGIDECETPTYGFYLYGEDGKFFNSLWLCWNMKKYCIHMPWGWDWVRTSNLAKNGSWVSEYPRNSLAFYEKSWQSIIKNEVFPYTYVCKDGTVQVVNATVKTSEMEWRLRGFKWFPWIKMVRRSIDIEFDQEVGEGRGSWKGGTVGCSYGLLPGETPEQCLRRMERVRVL